MDDTCVDIRYISGDVMHVKMYDEGLNVWCIFRYMMHASMYRCKMHAKLTNVCMSQFIDEYYVWCKMTW